MEPTEKQIKIPAEYGRSFKKGRVILNPESPILEFKDYYWPFPNNDVGPDGGPSKKIVLLKTICGFLNHLGGTILIGVKDDKEVKGVKLKENEIDLVKQYVNDLKISIYPQQGIDIVTEQLPIKDETQSSEKWIKNLYVIRIQVQQGVPNRFYTFKYKNYLCTSNRTDGRSAIEHDINKIQEGIFQKVFQHNKEVGRQQYLAPDPEGLSVSETRLVQSQILVDRNNKNGQLDLKDYIKDPSLAKLDRNSSKKSDRNIIKPKRNIPTVETLKKKEVKPPNKNQISNQNPDRNKLPITTGKQVKQAMTGQIQQEDEEIKTNIENRPTQQIDNPIPEKMQLKIPNKQNPGRDQPLITGKEEKLQIIEQVQEKPAFQNFVPPRKSTTHEEKNNQQEYKKQNTVELPLFIVRSQKKIDIVSRKINQKFNGNFEKKPKLKMVLDEVALVIGKTEKEIEFFQLLEQKDVVTSGPMDLLINVTDEDDINWIYHLITLFNCEATICINNNVGQGPQKNEEIIGFVKVQQIKVLDSFVCMIQILEENNFSYLLPDKF